MLGTIRPRNITATTAAAALVAGLVGCGGEIESPADIQPFTPEEVEGIPALSQPLTPLTTACAFDGATGIATVTVESGETAILAMRAVDSAFIANGVACGAATTSNLVRINVVENGMAVGDETVVLDFINGLFATGSASGVGVNVDLGGSGADTFAIRGSSSADRISLGAGGIATNNDNNLDITYANVDALVFTLGAGDDVYTGQGGNGAGTAYTGAITVFGGAGADTLTGGDGVDTLNGGDGNDTITGSAGDDVLAGDAGDDTFEEGAAASGADTFAGGAGVDTVNYGSRTVAVVVTIGAGANDGEAGETDDISATVEGVTGGSGNDNITGDGGDNILSGGAGDDTLVGGAGDDTLDGGDGADTIDEGNATSGADVIICGAGVDLVDYSGRSNALTVTMQTGANDGEASEGDDVRSDCDNLTAGGGNDSITGNALANTIDGGAGDDTLDGGAGNDIFPQGAADDGADGITGGLGDDLVDYSNRTADLTITMDDSTANDGLAGEQDDIGLDVEWVHCGTGDDNITGNDGDNVIEGGAGIDTVNAGAGNDTLFGEAGADILNGEAGDDIIDGGADDDAIDCGAGEGDIGWNQGGGGSITGCEL